MPDMAPQDACRTDPIFLQYSEVAFKSQLKKWKDANGIGDGPAKEYQDKQLVIISLVPLHEQPLFYYFTHTELSLAIHRATLWRGRKIY